MPRFRITKIIKAKNLREAIKHEPEAESIELLEEAKPEPNTHAIGFHIPPDYLNQESYDPSP